MLQYNRAEVNHIYGSTYQGGSSCQHANLPVPQIFLHSCHQKLIVVQDSLRSRKKKLHVDSGVHIMKTFQGHTLSNDGLLYLQQNDTSVQCDASFERDLSSFSQ